MATGFAVLEDLLRGSRPLSSVFREYLERHELYIAYSELAELLHFERTTFEQFGRSAADKAEYIRNARPIFDRMESIEHAVGRQFRKEFLGLKQIGFGIPAPIREPVRHEVILPSTWRVLQFELGMDETATDGIKYLSVRVADATKLSGADRQTLAAELRSEEAARANRGRRATPDSHSENLAGAIEQLSASIRNQPISVNVRQDTVDVRLVDVHPDLMRRAAGGDETVSSTATSPPGQGGQSGRPRRNNSAGRPTMKVRIFKLQVERWAAGQTEQSCAEEAREIAKILNKQFPDVPKPGEPSVPKAFSIENMIRHRYLRLRRTRNAINYLMGRRPI